MSGRDGIHASVRCLFYFEDRRRNEVPWSLLVGPTNWYLYSPRSGSAVLSPRFQVRPDLPPSPLFVDAMFLLVISCVWCHVCTCTSLVMFHVSNLESNWEIAMFAENLQKLCECHVFTEQPTSSHWTTLCMNARTSPKLLMSCCLLLASCSHVRGYICCINTKFEFYFSACYIFAVLHYVKSRAKSGYMSCWWMTNGLDDLELHEESPSTEQYIAMGIYKHKRLA